MLIIKSDDLRSFITEIFVAFALRYTFIMSQNKKIKKGGEKSVTQLFISLLYTTTVFSTALVCSG